MTHCFPKDREAELKIIAEAHGFNGPVFEGQGISKRVGSDCYGYYITSLKKKGKKTVAGIVPADDKFITSWTDGSMECSMPKSKKPSEWICNSGKLKDGSPKWWYCDKNGKKFNGKKAGFSFNGAISYRDPSF